MGRRDIPQELQALKILRSGGGTDALPRLLKALADPVNALAACAAEIIIQNNLVCAIPDLVTAFDRFMTTGASGDPQCLAKIAIARALKELGYRDSTLFMQGANCVQMEAVWGGKEDSAATLRATCLLALIQCPDLPRDGVFRQLVQAMTDRFGVVRVDAVRAVAEMGGSESMLLLRLKALLGDKDPAVTGSALECLIALEGGRGVEFAGGFLSHSDEDVQDEAALALGASRQSSAVQLLTEHWRKSRSLVILRALGVSRTEAANAFLKEIARTGREREVEAANEALSVLLG